MKFHLLDADLDPTTDCFNITRSEGGLVEVGVHRVIYGYRVQAWYHHHRGQFVDLNWCAGAEWGHVEYLYSLMLFCLSGIDEHEARCLRVLPPANNVKPYFKDIDFFFRLSPHIAMKCEGDVPLIALPPAPPIPAHLQAFLKSIDAPP